MLGQTLMSTLFWLLIYPLSLTIFTTQFLLYFLCAKTCKFTGTQTKVPHLLEFYYFVDRLPQSGKSHTELEEANAVIIFTFISCCSTCTTYGQARPRD